VHSDGWSTDKGAFRVPSDGLAPVGRSGPGQTAYFMQEVSNLEPLVFFSAVDSPLRAISKMLKCDCSSAAMLISHFGIQKSRN